MTALFDWQNSYYGRNHLVNWKDMIVHHCVHELKVSQSGKLQKCWTFGQSKNPSYSMTKLPHMRSTQWKEDQGSMKEGCDGVRVQYWWHCWGFIQNQRHYEPAWNICSTRGQWPWTHLQAVWGLCDPEVEWWRAMSDDMASTITSSKPSGDGLGGDRLHSNSKRAIRAHHLWELLQDCWKPISSDHHMKLMEIRPGVSKK